SATVGGVTSAGTTTENIQVDTVSNVTDSFVTTRTELHSAGVVSGTYTNDSTRATSSTSVTAGTVIDTGTESYATPGGAYSYSTTATSTINGTGSSASTESTNYVETYI
ncbi:hypothetical protein MHBO_004170, partial [Bonamia ostreae]